MASVVLKNPSSFARRLPWLVALGLIVAAGSMILGRQFNSKAAAPPETLPPPKTIGVSAWGRIAPAGEVIALMPITNLDNARVEKLFVAEGDRVVEGQPLAILASHTKRLANVAESKARLELAKAKLAQIEAGAEPNDIKAQAFVIERQESEAQNAKRQFERIAKLFAKNAITDEEHDAAQLKLSQAQALLAQSKAQLERLQVIRPTDRNVAACEVAQAETAVHVAEEDVAATRVPSPIAGTVLQILARPGQRIGEEGILKLGATDEMHAVAEVYEEDIAKIAVGQKATITLPSLDWKLAGEVVSLSRVIGRKTIFSNDPVSDTDARVIEVRVRLAPADSKRVEGLSNARVDVVIQTP